MDNLSRNWDTPAGAEGPNSSFSTLPLPKATPSRPPGRGTLAIWLWGKMTQKSPVLLLGLLLLLGIFLPLISANHPIFHWDSFPCTAIFVIVLMALANKNNDLFMETVLWVGIGINVHFRIALVATNMANLASTETIELGRLVVSMVCLSLVILTLIRHLWTSRISQQDSLWVAAAIYLMIALNFAQGFALLNQWVPGTFRIDETLAQTHDSEPQTAYHFPLFFYYSMVVITTMGFGDITPLTRFARSLTLLEGLVGQLYMVILMGKIVSLHIEGNRTEKGDQPSLQNKIVAVDEKKAA